MVRPRLEKLGIDASVTVLSKYMFPSIHIRDKYPNITADHRIENLRVLGRGNREVSRKDEDVIILQHDNFKDDDGNYIEMYCVPRWCTVTTDCPDDKLFDAKEEECETTDTDDDTMVANNTFAERLENNPYQYQDEEIRKRLNQHELLSLPKNHTFKNTTIVGCRTDYIQLLCSYCRVRRCRTYCACSPGTAMCKTCLPDHITHLLNNHQYQDEEIRRSKRLRQRRNQHELLSLPKNHTFKNTTIVGCRTDYIQLLCSYCRVRRCRTYCACSPGTAMCKTCLSDHITLSEM